MAFGHDEMIVPGQGTEAEAYLGRSLAMTLDFISQSAYPKSDNVPAELASSWSAVVCC